MAKIAPLKKPKINVNLFLIRYFKLIALVILVLSVAASYLFFVKPNQDKISQSLDRETERIEQEIAIKEKQLAVLAGRISGFETLQQQSFETMRAILPSLGEQDQLFLLLQEIMSTEGLHIIGFSLGVPVAVAAETAEGQSDLPIVKIPVTLALAGNTLNYARTKDLLTLLYNKYRIFELSSLDVMGIMTKTGNITLHFDVYFVGTDSTEIIPPGTAGRPGAATK